MSLTASIEVPLDANGALIEAIERAREFSNIDDAAKFLAGRFAHSRIYRIGYDGHEFCVFLRFHQRRVAVVAE